MKLRRTHALLAAVAMAALAACGSSSSGGGAASSGSASSGGSASGGALKVGTEGTYAPFTFHDPKTNKLTGYDVEVVEAVGAKLGRPVQFSESTFDAIFAGLEASRSALTVNGL